MINFVALSLLLSSLVTAGVFTPSQEPHTPQNDIVIVKEGHRAVILVEFEKETDGSTRVSISPPPQRQDTPFLHKPISEEAAATAEKVKETGKRQGPRELVCDAFGKCTHRIASVIGKAKEKVAEVEGGAKEVVGEAFDESISMSLQYKGSLSLSGHCAVNRTSKGRLMPVGVDEDDQIHEISSTDINGCTDSCQNRLGEKYEQPCCRCWKLGGLLDHATLDSVGRNNLIQLVYGATGHAGRKVKWIPELHHIG